MSLRNDAVELSRILNQIVASARHSRVGHAAELAGRIASSAARYDRAVFDLRSREEASDALANLAGSVSALSTASAKGRIGGVPR